MHKSSVPLLQHDLETNCDDRLGGRMVNDNKAFLAFTTTTPDHTRSVILVSQEQLNPVKEQNGQGGQPYGGTAMLGLILPAQIQTSGCMGLEI